MPEPNGYHYRVYKFNKNTYDAFANFQTLDDAVDYMRRWNPNQMYNWYIVDEDTNTKFKMNHELKLVELRPLEPIAGFIAVRTLRTA